MAKNNVELTVTIDGDKFKEVSELYQFVMKADEREANYQLRTKLSEKLNSLVEANLLGWKTGFEMQKVQREQAESTLALNMRVIIEGEHADSK